MPSSVAGVAIPDSKLAREVTELVKDTEPPLLFHHSSRVYYWGALTGKRVFDPRHDSRCKTSLATGPFCGTSRTHPLSASSSQFYWYGRNALGMDALSPDRRRPLCAESRD